LLLPKKIKKLKTKKNFFNFLNKKIMKKIKINKKIMKPVSVIGFGVMLRTESYCKAPLFDIRQSGQTR